jgi:hypothetical protein
MQPGRWGCSDPREWQVSGRRAPGTLALGRDDPEDGLQAVNESSGVDVALDKVSRVTCSCLLSERGTEALSQSIIEILVASIGH